MQDSFALAARPNYWSRLRTWIRSLEDSPYRNSITATIAIHVLNVIDASFTIYWVERGEAYEFNPIMAHMFSIGNYAFLLVKIALVLFGLGVFWLGIHKRLARVGIFGILLVYSLVVGFHILYLTSPELNVGSLLSNVPLPAGQ